MTGRLIFVIAAGLALCGCCFDGSGCYVPYVRPSATALASWDGFGPLPRRNTAKKRAKKIPNTSVAAAAPEDQSFPSEKELTKLRPYSREWGAALDAINRAYDDRLKRKLIICRDCMPPEPDDRTGSIGPERAAEGYLSLEASRSVSLPLLSPSSDGPRYNMN
jgi:hypothetical protein